MSPRLAVQHSFSRAEALRLWEYSCLCECQFLSFALELIYSMSCLSIVLAVLQWRAWAADTVEQTNLYRYWPRCASCDHAQPHFLHAHYSDSPTMPYRLISLCLYARLSYAPRFHPCTHFVDSCSTMTVFGCWLRLNQTLFQPSHP